MSQKLTAFESLHEDEREHDLQYHRDCHTNGGGAELFICFLSECNFRPVMMGSPSSLAREINSCTKKEYDILVSKDFLREFNERDIKIIQGNKENE